ncbi:MAG: acetyl-CoA hydrolase/transferase C-terminal domain-containing protein [Gammaproteobacteria bacterium]
MTVRLSLAQTAALLRPGMTVYVAGAAAEPGALLDEWAHHGDCAAGVTFVGVFLPGVNRRDLSTLGADARVRTFFVTPELRAAFAAGRAHFLPLHYSAIYEYLQSRAAIGLAVFQVSPPDRHGDCSLGMAVDFTPAVLKTNAKRLAVVNSAMPASRGGPRLRLSDFDYVVAVDEPLIGYTGGPVGAELTMLGRQIVSLIEDGDVIQFGLGKVQSALLDALRDHRDLAVHTGMIADPLLPLLDQGTVTRGVVTGIALGSRALYERAARDPGIRFRPVGYTHAGATLRRIQRLVTVNSILEVDLFGQANAEMLRGRQISGHGGLVDFLRGGRLAAGGKSILALVASAQDGALSRIVPHLEPSTVTTTLRADADWIVTEYGVADLRYATLDERAERLIAIAAPRFRSALADAWTVMRRGL